MDTLNELAAALNDDASFATTVTNSIAANTTKITANSASGVAISGWAASDLTSISGVGGTIDSVSGWALGTINVSGDQSLETINASGDFLRTSGIAVSGWAKAYVDTQDHSAASVSGWASSTISGTGTTNAANIASTGATNAAAIVVNTTALNASGDQLLRAISCVQAVLRFQAGQKPMWIRKTILRLRSLDGLQVQFLVLELRMLPI